MNLRVLLAPCTVAGTLYLLCCASVLAQTTVAIRDVTVVDVTDGSLQPGRTVLVEGDRIVAVGSAGEVDLPPDAEMVEGAGGYLIPGLWDTHVHSVRAMGTDAGTGSLPRVDWHFPLLLAHGVTGVRNMNDATADVTLELTNSVRRRLAEGDLPGPPRFLSAGPSIDGDPPLGTNSVVVGTAAEAREVVDALADAGADFVKVYENLSREAYFAIMDQARRRGLPVDGHIPFRITPEEAAEAGQRTVEHPIALALGCTTEPEIARERFARVLADYDSLAESDKALAQWRHSRAVYDLWDPAACASAFEAFRRHGVAVTVDLVLWPHIVRAEKILSDTAHLRLIPELVRPDPENALDPGFRELQSIVRPIPPLELESVRLANEAGVVLLAASDAGVPVLPGISLHEELARLVEAGLTPLEALQTATLNPARVLGMADSLGTIEAGKLADLVLLDANPLEDIANTQGIRAVLADGRLYRRADLDRLLARVEASGRHVETEAETHDPATADDDLPPPQVSVSADEAPADTVLAVAKAWIEAWNDLNAERMLQLHGSDLQFYWRGRPMSYDDFENVLREYIIPHESFSIEMVDPHVQLLGADAAVVAFNFNDKAGPGGEIPPMTAAVSLVLARRGGEWEIAHIHESLVRPLP